MLNQAPFSLGAIKLTNGVMAQAQRLITKEVLPYQWDVLNDRLENVAKSHALENFRIAAGLSTDAYYGMVFQDSDLYKWLEAVAYAVATNDDPELIAIANETIDLIAGAQQPDGYINTYYTVKEPFGRFTNLQQGHELYCAGHLFEAADAYYHATGQSKILEVACRFADYLCDTFGVNDGQIPGYPGHQEVEIGLVKLYKTTKCRRYLDLAHYFLNQRGHEPHYFIWERQQPTYREIWSGSFSQPTSYTQAHTAPRDQRVAVGHAVRALYMYSAMVDVARETHDEKLKAAAAALWANVTDRQMYVTGAVGASAFGESFTGDYDLPNDSAYAETCASVALMMFGQRIATLTGDGAYYDIVERAYFNSVLSGIAIDGKAFFYVNPLTVVPHSIAVNPGLKHVEPVRKPWFDCACCPTNIARTIMNIGQYAFAKSGDDLVINIPIASNISTANSTWLIDSDYPYGGKIRISSNGTSHEIYLRIGADVNVDSICVNGQPVSADVSKDGYVKIDLSSGQNTIDIDLLLRVRYVTSHLNVAENGGKVAILRGSVVYCAEEIDNGQQLSALILPQKPQFAESPLSFYDGAVKLTTIGQRMVYEGDTLYSEDLPCLTPADITLVPYALWGNRGKGEMRVFLNRRLD